MLPTQFATLPTYFQLSQLPKNPKILNVLLQLENDNKSKDTIKNVEKFLKQIDRNTDIDNPEQVKQFISRHQVSNSTKESISYAYRKYCKYHKIEAKLPYYQPDPKPIHVPTKEKLNIIISNASRLMTTKLRLSMETGLRPIEVHTLKVKDIDIDQRLVYPTTAKHGASRTLKISPTLTTMIQEHIIAKKLKPEDKLFKGYTRQYSKNYRRLRNRLADKLHDPTLRTIRLYDFRHYFCTKKIYELKNPWIVMNLMGHKRLETTQIYMHLLNLDEGEWVCEGATTKEQAMKLIESGFQYVTTIEETQLFKKPK